MAKAFDVARYLISLAERESEPEYLTHLRLQKLLYYVQGWSLAINGDPMFREHLEAWDHGPVVRDLYPKFADYKSNPIPPEDFSRPNDMDLDDSQKAFIESIWESYKVHSAIQLRTMTHKETPWIEARGDARPGERCEAEISQATMVDFFRELYRKTEIPGLELERVQLAREDHRRGIRGKSLEEVLAGIG